MTSFKQRPVPPPITEDSIEVEPLKWVSQGIGRITQWNGEQGVYQAWDPMTKTWSWGYEEWPGQWDWVLYDGQVPQWENKQIERMMCRYERQQNRKLSDGMWLSVLVAVVFFGFSAAMGVAAVGAICAAFIVLWGLGHSYARKHFPVATAVAENAYLASLVYRGVKHLDRH